MSGSSHNETPAEARGPDPGGLERRDLLKSIFGLGLAAGLQGCARRPQPVLAGQPPADPSAPFPVAEDEAAPPAQPAPALETVPSAEHSHPAAGDRLAFAFGTREGETITPADLEIGAPQVFAYPMDADGAHIASESRLDQVMLVRLDPSQLSEETAALSADGILAYSAVCTHTGCEISDWDEDAIRFRCPCHESEFDPADNGRVVGGPARRRLAALPLRIEDGVLVVAGGFTGRVGAERPYDDADGAVGSG